MTGGGAGPRPGHSHCPTPIWSNSRVARELEGPTPKRQGPDSWPGNGHTRKQKIQLYSVALIALSCAA